MAIIVPGGGAKLEVMRWGSPPPKMSGPVVTNVRNLDKPFWRPWLEPQWRCLVPVTDFCEWADAPPKRKKWFRLKDDTPFMFAGIWRKWTGVRGTKANPVEGEHKVFAFVTTQPNKVVSAIHAKAQPVILKREDWPTWLTAPSEIAMQLVRSSPDADMEVPADTPKPSA